MSILKCRRSIALAIVVVVLLGSRTAEAQVVMPPQEPGGLVNDVVTGVWYDRVNQAKALRQLQNRQAKLQTHAEQGQPAAVDRDVRRIDNLRFRIVVDEWLIRKNSLCDPGCYPYPVRLDPMSCAAIAQYRR